MNRKRKTYFLIMLCGLLLLLCGCQKAEQETRQITLLDGSTAQVPMQAERIAAVYGPAYEAMVVLGAEDRVVVCADVQFENFPWAQKIFKRITTLPYLANVHSSVSVETMLQYNPDIAFTFARPNELRQLEAAKVAAVPGITSEKFDDNKTNLMVYAQALGNPEAVAAAERYAQYFDEKKAMVKAVTDTIPAENRPKVYYAGIDMLTTYGQYSDLCQLVEMAGGDMVTKDLPAGNRTQINFEQLAAWNPEYIFIDHGGMNDKDTVEEILSETSATKRFQAIDAVKNGNVYLSPSGVFYWDMGLQKILLLLYVAKTIHPQEFADLDMAVEIQEFYQTFYDYALTRDEAEQILNREDPAAV